MKCVIYTRVSSKEQEKEGYSIPAQRKFLQEYARKHELKIVSEFCDVETAKTAGRIEFSRMAEYLRNETDTKVLLVEKTDRLYRNFKDYVILEEIDLEIHLVKESEIISSESRSHAKFVHGIKVLLAKNFIDNLSEEVKKGMKEKAEQGEYPAKAPIGYLNDKTIRKVIPNPKYVPLVRMLFEQYSSGNYSLKELRSKASGAGWRTVSGRNFSKSMVEFILKNPFYMGDFVWKNQLYNGIHEPLISNQLFDNVQAQLKKHGKPRRRSHDFTFKGLLKCAHCGCSIVGEIKKGKYTYYHCTQARGKCEQPWVREEVLDAEMCKVFKAIEVNDNVVQDIGRALKDSSKKEQEFRKSELLRLRKRFNAIQVRLDKAYEDRLDGVIDDAYWMDRSTKWRTEQNQLSEQIDRMNEANRDFVDQALEVLELSQMAYSLYVERDASEKRQLLKEVLSNCSIDGATLYPTYKKPFDLIAKGVSLQFKLPRLDSNQRPAD